VSRKSGLLDNENAQALLRNRERDAATLAAADIRAVMSTQQGRRFVWSLIESAGVYAPSFTGAAETTAFNEGRRSVGIGLMVAAQRDVPDLYVIALQEQLAAKRLDADTREVAQTLTTPDGEE
jgi:hypothetical protein